MSEMSRKVITMIIFIMIPVAVGIVSAMATRETVMVFDNILKPPFTPPAWAFPVVWTVLYVLMGIASYFIFTAAADTKLKIVALIIYFVQLGFNFVWSIIFFNMGDYTFSLIWLGVMWLMILALIILASQISKPAMFLLIPYIAWSSIAFYLNFMVRILNVPVAR